MRHHNIRIQRVHQGTWRLSHRTSSSQRKPLLFHHLHLKKVRINRTKGVKNIGLIVGPRETITSTTKSKAPGKKLIMDK